MVAVMAAAEKLRRKRKSKINKGTYYVTQQYEFVSAVSSRALEKALILLKNSKLLLSITYYLIFDST